MARIRSIKPEFFSHEELATKSAHARLLAIGLLTLADCKGRLRWVPMLVHAQVFPWEENVKIEVLLEELVSAGFVVHYEVDGRRYVQVVNFLLHQRLSGKEAAYESKLPAPAENSENRIRETASNPGKFLGASPGSDGNPLGTEEHRNIGTGEQSIAATESPRANPGSGGCDYPAGYERFWKAYPLNSKGRKRGKKAAFGLWRKVPATDRDSLVVAAENYGREESEFVKDPERFLKSDFWRDYVDEPEEKSKQSRALSGDELSSITQADLCQ